jgi:hypothetical protein
MKAVVRPLGALKPCIYHEAKHNPAGFHCEQCNYSTWRKDTAPEAIMQAAQAEHGPLKVSEM